MSGELARSLDALTHHDDPPYFASYEVVDSRRVDVSATAGTLTRSSDSHNRWLDVDVRVGDFALDNTHHTRQRATYGAPLPLADDSYAIRSTLWSRTDAAYQHAVEQLAKARAAAKVAARDDDTSDDFSRETPIDDVEPPAALAPALDRAAWETRLRALSAAFRAHPEIYNSSITLSAEAETRSYVASDHSRAQTPHAHYRVMIVAATRVDDGMDLHRDELFDVATADRLPTDDDIRARVAKVITDLNALRVAPLADPYSGPAILEGQAAGVFFHEVFGHRVEGHRQKDESEGQTFAKKIGQPIMPDFLDVYDDPTIANIDGVDLNGFYRFDDEGVPGAARDAGRSRRPRHVPARPLADARLRALERPRPPRRWAARRSRARATSSSRRRAPSTATTLAEDAARRGREPGQAVRPDLPRARRRLHEHGAVRAAGFKVLPIMV